MNLNLVTPTGVKPLYVDINEDRVKKIIHENDHPHPAIISGFSVMILVILFIVYIIFVKQDLSGDYYKDKDVYAIHHNKWNNTVHIQGKDTESNGVVLGSTIFVHSEDKGKFGVYYKDHIYWVSESGRCETWSRPKYY